MIGKWSVSQRAVALATAAIATSVLAGCGIAAGDETSKEHSAIQAANDQIGTVAIRNAFITTLPTTATTGDGQSRSYLVFTLVNNAKTADTLTGVSTSFGVATLDAGPDATVGSDGLTLPPGVVVAVSDPELDPDAATATITGTTPTVGTTESVSFSFANAGTTKQISVPVVSPGQSLTPTQVIPTDQATVPTPIA